MLQKNEQTKKQTDEQADWAEFIGPLPYTRGPENRKKKKKISLFHSPSIHNLNVHLHFTFLTRII